MWNQILKRRRDRSNGRRFHRTASAEIRTAENLEARQLLTVDIIFDYRYADDTSVFNSQAFEVFAEIEQVLESRLADTLAPWFSTSISFRNPDTGDVSTISQSIDADEIRIFVGGRNIDGAGGTLAFGSSSYSFNYARDEAGDHSTWGGSITVDTTENWHLDIDSNPGSDQVDFYSSMLHEAGHVIGIGASSDSGTTAWDRWVDAANPDFEGPASRAVWGGDVPLESDLAHFENNVYGPVGRELVFDTRSTIGTRKTMTSLDWAALEDVGWDVNSSTEIQLSVEQSTLGESGDTQTTATVTRAGGLTNSAETVYLTVTQNDDEVVVPTMVVIPEGSRTATFTIETTDDQISDGDQSVVVEVRSLRAENVTAQTTVVVVDDDLPEADLEVGQLAGPNSANAGDQVSVDWSVRNNGDLDVGSFNVRIFIGLGPDADPQNDVLLAEETVDGLSGGATSPVMSSAITLPSSGDSFFTGDGRYFFKIAVDSGDAVDETNEANNVDSSALTIGNTGASLNLDVDGDRTFQPLSDGIVVLRYLAGFGGDVLTDNAIANSAVRNTPALVSPVLDALRSEVLDVDGDGNYQPLTDGILVLRYLAGFRGSSLIANAVAGGASRSTAAAIESFLAPWTGQGSAGGAAGSDAAGESSAFVPPEDENEIDLFFGS